LAINWIISCAFIFVAVIDISSLFVMLTILPKKASKLKP